MDRQVLEAFVVHHKLPPASVPQVLQLAGAASSPQATRGFVQQVMRISGVLSLLAGIIFFIAANWDELGILGHFALIEGAFLISIVVACRRPPPHMAGRLGLLAAFVLAGGLLALFGQTYQTGADVYELFLTWSLLALPLAALANWSMASAAWLLVLNLALMLYSTGWSDRGWGLLGTWGWRNPAEVLLVPMLINLGLWLIAEYLNWPAFKQLAPRWVGRLAISCSVAYATWAGTYAILATSWHASSKPPMTLVMLCVGLTLLGICALALRRRRDILPLTAVAGSVIILVSFELASGWRMDTIGLMFFISLWLIGSSTIAGRWLMRLHRAWHAEEKEHAHA